MVDVYISKLKLVMNNMVLFNTVDAFLSETILIE